jgi:hypothetical protein
VWLSMAGRFSKSLYSAIQPGVRVRARKTACDSFICKHTVDVIRIYPLIPFHLLFTSRAAPQRESRCPSASPARVPSVDPSTRIRPFPLSLSLSLPLARACALNFQPNPRGAAVPDTDDSSSTLSRRWQCLARAAALISLL